MDPATMPEWISATPHVVSGMAVPDHDIELVIGLLIISNVKFGVWD